MRCGARQSASCSPPARSASARACRSRWRTRRRSRSASTTASPASRPPDQARQSGEQRVEVGALGIAVDFPVDAGGGGLLLLQPEEQPLPGARQVLEPAFHREVNGPAGRQVRRHDLAVRRKIAGHDAADLHRQRAAGRPRPARAGGAERARLERRQRRRERRSSRQRPAGEMTMRCAAEQAVHQHDFADRPFDRLDALFGYAMAVAQQGDVRGEGACLARQPIQRITQTLLQDFQADRAVLTAQNQRAVPEAFGAIEADAERRHRDARRPLLDAIDDIDWQAYAVADVAQRDMEMLGPDALARQTMADAQMTGLLADARRSFLVGQHSEEQPVCRRPHQGFVPALQPAKHQCRRLGLPSEGWRKQVLHGPLLSPCSLYVLMWKMQVPNQKMKAPIALFYLIEISVPPSPSNSVRATPLPGRKAGGWTDPVRMTSPAFSILPCLTSVLASQASEIRALPITALPGPLASSLPSSSERPSRLGKSSFCQSLTSAPITQAA